MSATVSLLRPLLSQYDLRLVCDQCSVKEKEITYRCKPVQHRCALSLLLCRAKGSSLWRPVFRRPRFPNPSQYEVCWFFKEGSGCTQHRNRCSFARSKEEAAVWTLERKYVLEHLDLCKLVAQLDKSDGPSAAQSLDLFVALDLKAVCDHCCIQQKEISYTIKTVQHKCSQNLLLAKNKASDQWRPVPERPTHRLFGRNVHYQVCNFFKEGSGCTQHGERCTYARSPEEAFIWNYLRDKQLHLMDLIRLIIPEPKPEPTVLTPQRAAEGILKKFPGRFNELCKECFYDQPPKLAVKKWNGTCSADTAHSWQPLLIHHPSEKGRRLSQVRPLPTHSPLTFCSHIMKGKPCWHDPGHCSSAQSEVEMEVWRAEQEGLLVRPLLLRVQPQLDAQQDAQQVSMYCKVCFLTLSSAESFYKHCSSLEHAQLLREDSSVWWRRRPPPRTHRADFWLCERPQTCEYGQSCPKAHSNEELQEWIMRSQEVKEIRQNIEAQGLMSYNEKLLQEYRSSSNEVHIMSEQVDDVSISCDEDLTLNCELVHTALQWHFQVDTEKQLLHVALLKQEPGACFSLDDNTSDPCIYSAGHAFLTDDSTYNISVRFTSDVPSLYEQWLVLDFDTRPVLLKKLRVRVGQPLSEDIEDSAVNPGGSCHNVERWHRGNRVIVPCVSRTEQQEELLKQYKPPQINFLYKSTSNNQTALNHDNYKARMHHFLYDEEHAEDQVVARLNVCGEMTIMDHSTLLGTKGRELFGEICLPCSLTADSPGGLALRRSIKSALIAPPSSGPNSKVYEATILLEQTTEDKLYLQLSKRCCFDLALKSNTSHQMEVQFQLNRYHFCCLHKAVDLLPDTRRVLPDLENCSVPVNDIHCGKLNAKQQLAVGFITGTSEDQAFVAPLLIYGPFGTGKTFTLATAARELCKQPHNKVLICTHTNSSADLYVRDHCHPFINKKQDTIRPVRIKANTGRGFYATDEITLKYCFLNKNRDMFLPPTKAVLDQHNIIIITTTMALHLYDLGLPDGYFSHILIDETSQMLECEALAALGLAGPDTRVALAGDYMQMGPKLFSVDDHKRSDHTLLTRLFHYYQVQKCDTALRSRVILSENYRSTREIVDFVSTHFYIGDVIRATDRVPPPADGQALKFCHVRGECLLDTWSRSWYNSHEATRVVKAVKDVLQNWPSTWGPKEPCSICVLSEGVQVKKIRTKLSKQILSKVQVQNLANVQGLQFRVVIMSAVHTRDSLKTCHVAGLELFNDARVLNTALTRAQSLVMVVGDAAALSCFGQCSQIWKSYIDHCIHNNSVEPQYFTKGFFEKGLMETERFQKSEQADENSACNYTILEDLKEGYEQFNKELICDDDIVEGPDSDHQKAKASHNVTDSDPSVLANEPHGKLVKESYIRGHVIPFKKPNVQISSKRRKTLWRAFTVDEGITQMAKVDSINKPLESAPEFVCFLDYENHSKNKNSLDKYISRMMIPINKSEPKIVIHINKKMRKHLPVWKEVDGDWRVVDYKKLDESLRQNHVFLVQVINWKEYCDLPLGNVVNILPIGKSFSAGLQILNKEYNIVPTLCKPENCIDRNKSQRKNMCNTITFTVDPPQAKDLDDAISVEDNGEQYELGVHIADVASFVTCGDELDEDAKQRCVTFYCNRNPEETIHMFPPELSTELLSLLPGKERSVVSLLLKVDKQTNEIIGGPEFLLSTIKSDRKLSYEDAEEVINKRSEKPVEHCIKLAYQFAKAQRKKRLQNWPYAQPDDSRLPGQRKAHFMIEELSVLFNKCVAEKLSSLDQTRSVVPLRCQKPPDQDKIEEVKEQCADLIPLSFCLWHKVDCDEQNSECENFCVLEAIWKNIRDAAEADDKDRLVDLIATDDIHPQLQPVTNQFRRCLSKAYFSCPMSSPEEVGHYSLSLQHYTMASSPIRRYIDLVLQRLLHCYILRRPVPYSHTEITALCKEFDKNVKVAKEYERKAENISYAVGVMKQSICKIAFVVKADTDADSFLVAFPFNRDIFEKSMSVMYRNLQLNDQPLYVETSKCMMLRWKRRIYAADKDKELFHQEMKTLFHQGPCVELPFQVWKSTVEAIKEENWGQVKSLITSAEPKQVLPPTSVNNSEKQEQHEVDISLSLRPGDTLQVQMTCEVRRCYWIPSIQLVSITPKFEICVDHVHNPITCFSRSTDDPSKIQYLNTDDYIRIWKPLCEMESAATAVRESDNLVIENLVVNFSHRNGETLTGNFFIRSTWIDEWAIGFNLSRCYLCIRKQGLELKREMLQKHNLSEYIATGDPREFTWVAHCITTNVDVKKKPPNEGSTVHFYVNHLPMEDIPDCVYKKNTTFTVEIIPKMLPDIRKESAVVNVSLACDLVKSIAVGRCIPEEVLSTYTVKRNKLPDTLPPLNDSQLQAVAKAVNNSFTVIQGPPGTGKTVVGACIVYFFWKMNKESPRKIDPDSKDKDKKEVILFCGPSNKSVDVVAEYMMKFKDRLNALRVYSQQVEMQDYPYPECVLQLSSKTRPDRSNPALRNMTLHQRIRESSNPHAADIIDFDKRIKEALRTKTPFTAEEVKAYRKLLKDARKYELERHDIILCTCTQSSSPGLTETISARQILIDECAMATEPQAMIPFICNKSPEKIVLLGDHKQLRPIVITERVKKLGMGESLFERYYTRNILPKERTVMLDTQYRMHEDICRFPSEEYYEGKLKTGVKQPNSVLRVDKRIMPVVFGDVTGITVRQVVSTSKGNENSKANREEREKVVEIAKKLVGRARIGQESIVILSPYNAQVSEIKERLKEEGLDRVNVSTITKSQGSEWRYVIISTVCSLPSDEIESEPTGTWFSKHLGFVGDPNQINVAISRAKEGLCIIGNQELLSCSRAWSHLLDHYKRNNAVTDADKISVC